MPTYRQSVGDNISYLQQQIHRQGTAPFGPVSVGPGEGHIRFVDASGNTLFTADSSGAQVRFRGGLQGLTDRLENDATAIEGHTKMLGEHIRRLNTVDGRLDGHDSTLASHGDRLGSAESRLSGHDSAISAHNTRINNAQNAANAAQSRADAAYSLAATKAAQSSVDQAISTINALANRVAQLEARMAKYHPIAA